MTKMLLNPDFLYKVLKGGLEGMDVFHDPQPQLQYDRLRVPINGGEDGEVEIRVSKILNGITRTFYHLSWETERGPTYTTDRSDIEVARSIRDYVKTIKRRADERSG